MKPNNLLVIMSDEHQARAMGAAGHPFVQTPHLDRLAEQGTRYSNAYTPSPICVPARAAFATGRHVHRIRNWDNAMPYSGAVPGWGHALQRIGVPVESIGKLHYRFDDDPAGFDIEHMPMQVVGGHGMVWASIREEDAHKDAGRPRMLGPEIGPGESSYTRYDAAVVERTTAWLQAAPDKPWCLYVGLVAPHFPLVCPEQFYRLYPEGSVPEPKLHPTTGYVRHPWIEKQNALMDSENQFADPAERLRALSAYYGLVSWVDYNVGQIVTALDACGLRDDTTILYTSDHGDNAGARGLWGKSNMYEESVAVPLIVSGPGTSVGVEDIPVSLIDVSATIADCFGAQIEGDGVPLTEAVRDTDRSVFSEYHAAGAVSGAYMLRKGRWKLIRYLGFEDELFDLVADPEETQSLASDPTYADVVADLRASLATICDVEAANAQAFEDQAALIARHGGRDAAIRVGAPGATPPPKV